MGDNNKRQSLVKSDAFPGILLLCGTVLALICANTPLDKLYNYVLYKVGIGEEFNIHFFINEFLMAIFFLVVGFEIKRELVYGKLSSVTKASFPVIAAVGGMALPAVIFTIFNYKTRLEIGVGIPLSTDIAFAIGVFSILKSRLNKSLEVFLLTLAVVDDLLSIVIIGIFYSSNIRISGIMASIVIIIILLIVRKYERTNHMAVYVFLGIALWGTVFYSGIHSTLSGVILAFCMPIYDEKGRDKDLSYRLQHKLEGITNFVILPLFAFANTGIRLIGSFDFSQDYPLMIGIIAGLVLGKPLGIMTFGYIGNLIKIAKKPAGSSWYDVFVVSVIAGIGFTMSLFISEIAFKGANVEISASKISILIAAVISTILSVILAMMKKKA